MNRIRLAVAMVAFSLLTSCAATLGRGPFPVSVDSEPPGATVIYGGNRVGVTPCAVAMRGDQCMAELQLDGFHAQRIDVGTRGNTGLILGGILLFGPFELLSAATTDAWMRVNDEHVFVRMSPVTGPVPACWTRPEEVDDAPRTPPRIRR